VFVPYGLSPATHDNARYVKLDQLGSTRSHPSGSLARVGFDGRVEIGQTPRLASPSSR
jgi:hypothetical protein